MWWAGFLKQHQQKFYWYPSRSLTASFPLKSFRNPIGKDRLPTINFSGSMLNFGGVWHIDLQLNITSTTNLSRLQVNIPCIIHTWIFWDLQILPKFAKYCAQQEMMKFNARKTSVIPTRTLKHVLRFGMTGAPKTYSSNTSPPVSTTVEEILHQLVCWLSHYFIVSSNRRRWWTSATMWWYSQALLILCGTGQFLLRSLLWVYTKTGYVLTLIKSIAPNLYKNWTHGHRQILWLRKLPPTSSWRIWVCPRRGAISPIPRAFWKHRQITEKTIYVQSLYFFVPYTFSFWPTCISMHPSDTGFYTSQVLSQIFSINNIIPFFQPPFGSMVVCFIRLFCRRVFPYISRISCIHTAYMTVRIPPSYS